MFNRKQVLIPGDLYPSFPEEPSLYLSYAGKDNRSKKIVHRYCCFIDIEPVPALDREVYLWATDYARKAEREPLAYTTPLHPYVFTELISRGSRLRDECLSVYSLPKAQKIREIISAILPRHDKILVFSTNTDAFEGIGEPGWKTSFVEGMGGRAEEVIKYFAAKENESKVQIIVVPDGYHGKGWKKELLTEDCALVLLDLPDCIASMEDVEAFWKNGSNLSVYGICTRHSLEAHWFNVLCTYHLGGCYVDIPLVFRMYKSIFPEDRRRVSEEDGDYIVLPRKVTRYSAVDVRNFFDRLHIRLVEFRDSDKQLFCAAPAGLPQEDRLRFVGRAVSEDEALLAMWSLVAGKTLEFSIWNASVNVVFPYIPKEIARFEVLSVE